MILAGRFPLCRGQPFESAQDFRAALLIPDFQKLLVARAWLRVMIFQQPSSDAIRRVLNRLKQVIERFAGRQTGDRFLFAAWNYKAREGVEFSSYTV